MNERNLALAYRPKSFSDVVEQDVIITILKQLIKSKNIPAAMLFAGPSGVAKTSVSRIFANELNGGKGSPIELDTASNNGVDYMRDITENARFKSMDSEYKVFILDEFHMATTQSSNSLLKTLEEPPSKTLFILCTTDPQKIIPTILSRCQRYDFKRITDNGIKNQLKKILRLENKSTVSDGAIEYITKLSSGGLRSAVMMLDKCLSIKSELDIDDVISILGLIDYNEMINLLDFIAQKKVKEAIILVNKLYNEGVDLRDFVRSFLEFMIDFNKYKLFNSFDYVKIPSGYKNYIDQVENVDYLKVLKVFINLNNEIKYCQDVKSLLEAELIMFGG